jgi:uncharacterized protein
MTTVFVDTAYFVALLDRRDSLHERALKLAKKFDDTFATLVTSDAVLIELANYFARTPLRPFAIDWVFALRESQDWQIVALSPALLVRAEALYRAHRDKTWSVTDCCIMETMRDRRISEIATTDRGFKQAGFKPLLEP